MRCDYGKLMNWFRRTQNEGILTLRTHYIYLVTHPFSNWDFQSQISASQTAFDELHTLDSLQGPEKVCQHQHHKLSLFQPGTSTHSWTDLDQWHESIYIYVPITGRIHGIHLSWTFVLVRCSGSADPSCRMASCDSVIQEDFRPWPD